MLHADRVRFTSRQPGSAASRFSTVPVTREPPPAALRPSTSPAGGRGKNSAPSTTCSLRCCAPRSALAGESRGGGLSPRAPTVDAGAPTNRRISGGAVWASRARREVGHELVERAVPALDMSVAIGRRRQALLTQAEFGLSVQLAEFYGNQRFTRVAFHAPGVGKALVRFDLREGAGDVKGLAIRQMHGHAIASADPRLEQGYVAVDPFRSKPGRPFLSGEPCVEDFRRGRIEDARDLEHGVFDFGGHDFRSFLVCLRRASRRSKLPIQNERWKSIHSAVPVSASGLRWQRRCLPWRSLLMSEASSSTFRCREIAGSEILNGKARSPTVASTLARRARIARRVGSASAAKVWFRPFI